MIVSKNSLESTKSRFLKEIKPNIYKGYNEDIVFFGVSLVYPLREIGGKGKRFYINFEDLSIPKNSFISYFIKNFEYINHNFSDFKEWNFLCSLHNVFNESNGVIANYSYLSSKYRLSNISYNIDLYSKIISSMFVYDGITWNICSTSMLNKDDTRVSPFFLGLSDNGLLRLLNAGIHSIQDIKDRSKIFESVIDYFRSNEVRLFYEMDVKAIIDYIEKGIVDPSYYRSSVYLERYRLCYVIGRYLSSFGKIVIQEDSQHPNSFYLYSEQGSHEKRIRVSPFDASVLLKYKQECEKGKDIKDTFVNLLFPTLE